MKQGWEIKKLGEVFDLQMGKTPSRDNRDYWGGSNVWVAISDLQDKYIGDSKEYITDKALTETKIKKVKAGTTIMSFKLSVGRVAITTKDLYTNEAIMAFNLNEGYNLIADYIYYYLKGYKWQGANKAVMGLTLNKASISQNHIIIPPIEEQERIVEELDCLSGVIEKKREQLKELDALAESIFYQMFGDPITNEKGWEVKKLSDAVSDDCPISYGIVQPMEDVEGGIPIVRPIDLVDTFVRKDNLKRTSVDISNAYKRTILRGDEILMCVRGTTGVVSMASDELKGCNTTRGIVPLFFDSVNRWFVYYLIKQPSMQCLIAENTYGIALKQINIKELRLLPIITPPLSFQQEFADKIEAIEKQKELIKQSITQTETLFNARMDYYFN